MTRLVQPDPKTGICSLCGLNAWAFANAVEEEQRKNERLRAALEKIGNLKEVNDDTLTDAVMLASRALASDNHHYV